MIITESYRLPDAENPGRELRICIHEGGKITVSVFQDGVMLNYAPRSGMFETSSEISFEGESRKDLYAVLAEILRRHPV